MILDNTVSDPLHTTGVTGAFANVNGAEAFGGVIASPLGWTFFERATELAMRRALADFGAIRRREVPPPGDRNRRYLNAFYGRPGTNVNLWRETMDGIWGSSGASYDRAFHGGKEGTLPHSVHRRGSAARFLMCGVRGRVALAYYRWKLPTWWRASVRPGSTSTIEAAKAKYREAAAFNEKVMRAHSHVSWIGLTALEHLRSACTAGGHPGLELEVLASDDEFEEQGLIIDMWAVSRGTRSLDDFLARWGFQGPAVGELSSHSWREDPSPLFPIIDAYRARPETDAPATLKDRQRGARRAAEQKLLAGRPFFDRCRIRVLVYGARTFVPLRQVGRGAFLKTYDVARCMARRIGEQLVDDGLTDVPEDVFYLTESELIATPLDDLRTVVSVRRKRSQDYETIELPERWIGDLTEGMVHRCVGESTEELTSRPDRIEGLGVSAGVVEGRAIIVTQPDSAYDLAPRDILVCRATDPSWAAIFYAVDGLVTDIGAQMSHGAIVARELGIPAVVNTRTGTKDLRTGDYIRVDGNSGVVEVLRHATERLTQGNGEESAADRARLQGAYNEREQRL